VFSVATPSGGPRPRLAEILRRYAELAPPGLEARGGFEHFRRMGPPSWPRAVHYELLDYGVGVGAEIHLESDAMVALQEPLRGLEDPLARHFPDRRVEWDADWWRGRGRLRVLFDDSAPAEDVAAGLRKVIDLTFAQLDPLARKLPGLAPERQ